MKLYHLNKRRTYLLRVKMYDATILRMCDLFDCCAFQVVATIVQRSEKIIANEMVEELFNMKRIVTLSTRKLMDTAKHGGCGACQTSCQSACKTSCGVANQRCENQMNK